MTNEVIILRGIVGSGKSSYAHKIIFTSSKRSVICSADDYFVKRCVDGTALDYMFDVTKLPEAHAICFRTFLKAIHEKVPLIIVDNTNIHRWEYMNYEMAAILSEYDMRIVELQVDTIDQLKKCCDRNVHRVPREVIARQAMEFEHDSRATVVSGLV